MKLDRRAFLGAVAASLWPATAHADAVDDLLGRIADARNGLTTVRATFKQTRTISVMATEIVSTGSLALVRPDRLRWDLDPPDAVTYWIGPEGLTMKNAEGVTKIDKASTDRFAAVLADLMIMLGGDVRSLRARYAIKMKEKEDHLQLSFTPNAGTSLAKHIKRVALTTPKDDLAKLRAVGIYEQNDDKSIIRFASWEKNATIAPDEMKPPSK
jgi:outer membrane lipoprotein-sorting protein